MIIYTIFITYSVRRNNKKFTSPQPPVAPYDGYTRTYIFIVVLTEYNIMFRIMTIM